VYKLRNKVCICVSGVIVPVTKKITTHYLLAHFSKFERGVHEVVYILLQQRPAFKFLGQQALMYIVSLEYVPFQRRFPLTTCVL
jgi:hypothetical protein